MCLLPAVIQTVEQVSTEVSKPELRLHSPDDDTTNVLQESRDAVNKQDDVTTRQYMLTNAQQEALVGKC